MHLCTKYLNTTCTVHATRRWFQLVTYAVGVPNKVLVIIIRVHNVIMFMIGTVLVSAQVLLGSLRFVINYSSGFSPLYQVDVCTIHVPYWLIVVPYIFIHLHLCGLLFKIAGWSSQLVSENYYNRRVFVLCNQLKGNTFTDVSTKCFSCLQG